MAKKHCRKFQPAEKGARTLQTTDGRAITYSESEREFKFAKNESLSGESIMILFSQSAINIIII